jgi:hypothetical protein
MRVAGLLPGAALLAFVQAGLGPHWRPGQGVGREHLKAPKLAGVREAMDARGARLRAPPPDSSDCSPREAGWSQRKARWWTKAARTLEHRWQASTQAVAAIPSEDAQGGFTHAG